VSCKVLVIPEDPTNNGYIRKPLVEAILRDIGKPKAKVTVLTTPRLRGYDSAIKAIREELYNRYGFWDLWLFFPDADRATPEAMQELESHIAKLGCRLLCCIVQPEVEIFACAGYRAELGAPWEDVRRTPHLKEEYFKIVLAQHGDARRPGAGRDLVIRTSLNNVSVLYKLCPELQALRDRCKERLT